MRLALAICVTLLAGCSSRPSTQPPTPTPEGIDLGKVGQGLDAIDSKVAASIAVARDANTAGKPAVVESELSVAGSFLPRPTEGDLAIARQRSEKASPAEYEAQRKAATAKQQELEKAWDRLEKQVTDNKTALEAKDKQITQLTAEVDRVKQEASANLWTMAGVGIAVIGAIATAFVGPKVGIPLLACGAAIGAFPVIADSEYFGYIVGTSLALAAGLGIYLLWDKVRDAANRR